MLAACLGLYCILCLYGMAMFYKNVQKDSCDPSAAIPNNDMCQQSGPDVFGAMLSIAFALQGISQFGNVNFSEAFMQAHVAIYKALKTIHHILGQMPAETIYKNPNPHLLELDNGSGNGMHDDDDLNVFVTTHSNCNHIKKNTNANANANANAKLAEPVIHAILPKYKIDATSTTDIQPREIFISKMCTFVTPLVPVIPL